MNDRWISVTDAATRLGAFEHDVLGMAIGGALRSSCGHHLISEASVEQHLAYRTYTPSELASPRADVLAENGEQDGAQTTYRDALGAYLGDEPEWRLTPTEPPSDIGPDAEDEYREEKRT
jgi:hypothetical protein